METIKLDVSRIVFGGECFHVKLSAKC